MIRKLPYCINPFMPIPTAYANALSYSEVQSMLVSKLNEVINEVNNKKENVYFSTVEVSDITVGANDTATTTITVEHRKHLKIAGCTAYSFAVSDDLVVLSIEPDSDNDELAIVIKNLSESSVTDDLQLTLIYATDIEEIQ